MTYSRQEREEFLAAYVEATVWSSLVYLEEDSEPVDADSLDFVQEAYSALDAFVPEAQERILKDCQQFMDDNMTDLLLAGEGYARTERGDEWSAPSMAGHDFALTRGHHGAGFWDRGLGAVGERLTQACKAFRETNLYVTDDSHLDIE